MKRSLPLILILAGILTMVVGLGTWVVQTSESLQAGIRLPGALADLPLGRSVAGAEAMEELTRLHGRPLQVNTARFGAYGAGDQIQLWVARAPSPPAASQLVAAMGAAIAEGRSPFNPLGEKRQGDRMVYQLAGLGQLHYYFQSADLLVWLAVDEPLSKTALRQTLEFFP